MNVVSADDGYTTSNGTVLKTLSKPATISSNFVTDIQLSSAEKFKYWFLDSRTTISFPNLSSIEYGAEVTQEQKDYIEQRLGFTNA